MRTNSKHLYGIISWPNLTSTHLAILNSWDAFREGRDVLFEGSLVSSCMHHESAHIYTSHVHTHIHTYTHVVLLPMHMHMHRTHIHTHTYGITIYSCICMYEAPYCTLHVIYVDIYKQNFSKGTCVFDALYLCVYLWVHVCMRLYGYDMPIFSLTPWRCFASPVGLPSLSICQINILYIHTCIYERMCAYMYVMYVYMHVCCVFIHVCILYCKRQPCILSLCALVDMTFRVPKGTCLLHVRSCPNDIKQPRMHI